VREHAALQLCLVVERGLRKQVQHRTGGAGLGIGGAEHHAGQARVQHRAAAHRARLERDVQRAAVEAVVTQALRRGAQGDDLGVCARIVRGDGRIAPRGDQLAVLDHDSPHRHLARLRRRVRLRKREAHPVRILRTHVDCFHTSSCLCFTHKGKMPI